MASKVQRGGKTFTEVYSELIQLKEAYKQKTAEADHMDRTLQAVLAQIEERAPILAQQRAEYERLQTEAEELSAQLADAIGERDTRSFEAREASQKLTKTTRENDLLQQQLNDLGRQIQVLLKELGRRQDPSIPSDEELEQDLSTQPAENAEEFISNNLVLFRSIPALQEQNQKLLKIVREMGEKMEREEQEYREELQKEQNEAVREAYDTIRDLQEQLENTKRASEVRIQAYVKERDMVKEMRGREEGREPPAPRTNGAAAAASESEIAKELAEVNSQFEMYKLETGVDSSRLREDLISAQREIGQLGAALAKANAKLDFMTERQLMAQDQYNIQSRELDDLTKRHQQLYDRYTRIDIECNRVTEEYLSANGHIEQLRTECANLRAEKKISDNAVNRITEENKALSVERAHLADLMKNVQKMHSDLERSNENDRRRLESQIQMLDNQNQDLRTQLSQERESLRHVTMQKDVEMRDFQSRLEKQTQELASTRESLIKAETSQKHLEARCEDLSKQVQAKEEKLSVYERRPSSLHGVTQPAATDGMSREQQLESEIADLRGALKVAEVDLANARNHAQQFQEISQANEEALSTLNASYDEYKASMHAEIANRESNLAGVQARLQSAEAELNQSREALAEMTRKLEEEREAWTNDRKDLEATIIDLTTSEKSFAEESTSRESAVREQEERVKALEEKYNQTVLAHAESIKTIDELRQKLAEVQSSTRNNLIAAETAKAQLASSEVSWTQQRQALEKEMADLTARSKELTEQNNMLHQHLESVTSQAARIRQAADATGATGEAELTDDTKLSELRAVIGYLRREKEILQMQLDLSKTENGRLRTQIGRLTQDLEQTKTALSEERERAVAAAATDAQHADLVEKINQLTILRESNATLRVDSEAHAKRARELDTKVKALTVELEPLREEARVAKAELEARNRDVERLQEESSRWQARNTQLLSKYDRIDPSEVQALKETIERLQSEKAAMESAVSSKEQDVQKLNQKIEEVNKSLQSNKEIGIKNIRVFRQRMETFNTDMASMKAKVEEVEAQLAVVTAERDALQAEKSAGAATIQVSSEEVEKLKQEKAALEEALQSEKSKEVAGPVDTSELEAKIVKERDKLSAEMESLKQSAGAAAGPDLSQWEAEKAELLKSRDEALATAQSAKKESAKLKEDARNLKMSNDKFQARLHEQQQARQRLVEEHDAAVKAAVEKASSEIQSTSADFTAATDLVKQHAEELRDLEERLKAQHQEELQAATAKAKEEAAPAAHPPSAGDKAIIDAASSSTRPSEGRGIGLLSKIRAYNLQDLGHDTVTANLLLGHKADERGYEVAVAILRDLGLGGADDEGEGVRLLTNNPDKVHALEKEGLRIVERVPMVPRSWRRRQGEPMVVGVDGDGEVETEHERKAGATMVGGEAVHGEDLEKYLRTKVLRMGHMLPLRSEAL
ncbi:hypothetical protein EWM64_g4383 [Hericium alpestre]|uniref:Nucleoprotein TPR/MLP1 domain-containing protein n=1 Tax=Hericium alpestre TaxID=135208 RepID=A0A4Z0A0A5_9AGAM|nr:hypothetical protein EWM64_g4383 [Hericium alpestre]